MHASFRTTLDEFPRDLFVKQIAHRIHKDQSRLTPGLGQIDDIFVERNFEAVMISSIAHRLEAQSQTLGIAILATSADLRAAGDRIPRRLCPFNV